MRKLLSLGACSGRQKAGRAEDGRPECLERPIGILARRVDFLKAARARRVSTPGFLLQARRRKRDEAAAGIRVGFTCSRKVGNAVARNRAKRRLREVARLTLPQRGRDGWDYVLIGRPKVTASRPFAALRVDLDTALCRVHA